MGYTSDFFDDRESGARQYNGTELLHTDKHKDNINTIINHKTKHTYNNKTYRRYRKVGFSNN